MANKSELGQKWEAIYISSSVANWEEKLRRKFKIPKWHFLKSRGKSAVFFGMYNPVDYFRFLWHRGPKTVFWCGTDILNLQKRPIWQKILNLPKAYHICENVVEEKALMEMGIRSDEVKPCLFDDMSEIEISFNPYQSKRPHVYLCIQQGRELEYGLHEIFVAAPEVPEITFHVYGGDYPVGSIEHPPNVIFHNTVSNVQFNWEIKHYQAAIRLNEFDGFSEIIAKSILMGQYPISRIPYPHMDSYQTTEELIELLRKLKDKRVPNPATPFWRNLLGGSHVFTLQKSNRLSSSRLSHVPSDAMLKMHKDARKTKGRLSKRP